jgi:hypothetical protein
MLPAEGEKFQGRVADARRADDAHVKFPGEELFFGVRERRNGSHPEIGAVELLRDLGGGFAGQRNK